MENPAIYHRRQISPLAPLGRDDREEPGRDDREPLFVIPGLPPSVIPGLTGNLSRWQSGYGTVRHQNGEKHDGRSRFGMFHPRFRHRPTGICPKSCRTVSGDNDVDCQSVMSDWSEEVGVYFGSTRQRRICDSLRWRTL